MKAHATAHEGLQRARNLSRRKRCFTVEFAALTAIAFAAAGSNPLLAADDARQLATSVPLAIDAGRPIRNSFEQTFAAALDRASRAPADATAQLSRIEALLALGRAAAAEEAAIGLADRLATDAETSPAKIRQQSTVALRLWLLARLRQALPLDEPRMALHRQRWEEEPALTALRFWTQILAGRAPYRFDDDSLPTELALKRKSVWSRFRSRQLESIEATIGRTTLPVVFIDTGAQYTILSTAAAQAAGVVSADRASEMVGFATFAAVPGLIPELRLGRLRLRDVPVFVGDSPALARAKGQMAIGTDLLHHLRLTLEVDAGRATFEPAAQAAPLESMASTDGWQVRLWPLPQACLAEAQLAGNLYARVLIDTGNWEGTYVSARWASHSDLQPFDRRLPAWMPLERTTGSLAGLQLGGQIIDEHSVRGVLPAELERLDLVDILVGHELLEHQRLTIDLAQRLLRCERTAP